MYKEQEKFYNYLAKMNDIQKFLIFYWSWCLHKYKNYAKNWQLYVSILIVDSLYKWLNTQES
jgi:acetone carboxylase gamma subunit